MSQSGLVKKASGGVENRDQRVESLLKRGNYQFVLHDKEPLSNIDLKASAENPARINRKIEQDRVIQYGCAMIDGAVFPPLVLLRRDQAKLLVATGMHRIRAAQEAKIDTFDSYIVTETDQYRCDLLIRLLNGLEGRGDTIKEQLWHVISLHEQYSRIPLTQLANEFSISKQTVTNAWNEHQGIRRGSRLGFDFEKTQKQPQSVIVRLNQIPSDLVYMKAAEFVVHYDVVAREVEELVQALKDVRHQGEGAEIGIIKKFHDAADEKQRRAKSRIGRTNPTACTLFISKVRSVNKQARRGIEHLHLSAISDYDDAHAVIDDGIEHLIKIKAELERIQRLAGSASSGLPLAASASS